MKNVLIRIFVLFHEINLRIQRYIDEAYLELLRRRGANIGKRIFARHLSVEEKFSKLLTIEDEVVFAYGTRIILHDSALNNLVSAPIKFGKVIIRRTAYIGARCTILPGVEIGEGAIIGACSLVTKDIPPYSIAFGIPARVVDSRENYEKRFIEASQENGNDKFSYMDVPAWKNRGKSDWGQDINEAYKDFLDNFV